MKRKIIKYQLITASGNPTAIVYGRYRSKLKQEINQTILKANKLVEQIGYLYKEGGKYKLEMMGDEFSGNGCRATAFSILKFKSGKTSFKTSGTKKTIFANVKNNITTISVPYIFNEEQVLRSKVGFLIKMYGSFQLVLEKEGNLRRAQKIINKNFKKTKATGIMFIKKKSENKVELNPFFWVRKTRTLINETACGSGSIAVAIYLTLKNKKSFSNLTILQPSGKSILIQTIYDNRKIKNIKISGPTKFLGDYKIVLS